jgi:hypothetical protein
MLRCVGATGGGMMATKLWKKRVKKDSFTLEEMLAGPYPRPWMLEDQEIAANLEKNPGLCEVLNYTMREAAIQGNPSPGAQIVPFLQNTPHFRKVLREWVDPVEDDE